MNKLLMIFISILIIGCSKEDISLDGLTSTVTETGESVDVLSGWTIALPIDGSGSEKVIIRHTPALRTMARTGNINPLKEELGGSRNDILNTGHKSDINRIGFAPQLHVEHYIIAMYHPNNYPDHFIIYNIDTKEWTRYEEGNSPTVYLSGTGD